MGRIEIGLVIGERIVVGPNIDATALLQGAHPKTAGFSRARKRREAATHVPRSVVVGYDGGQSPSAMMAGELKQPGAVAVSSAFGFQFQGSSSCRRD